MMQTEQRRIVVGDLVRYNEELPSSVGKVLRTKVFYNEDDPEEENGRYCLYIQWPDSGYEYVKPCWSYADRFILAAEKETTREEK